MVSNEWQHRRRGRPGDDPHRHHPDGCDVLDHRYYDSDGGAAKSRYLKSDRRSLHRERRKRAYLLISTALLTIALIVLVTTEDAREGRGLERLRRLDPRSSRGGRRRAEARRRAKLMGYGSPGDDGSGVAGGGGDDGGEPGRRRAPVRSPTGRYRWTDPRLLPALPGQPRGSKFLDFGYDDEALAARRDRSDFRAFRPEDPPMDWELEQDEAEARAKATAEAEGGSEGAGMGPKVDYTQWEYTYPDPKTLTHPPEDGSYPPMDTLGGLLKKWPQDDIDDPPSPFPEALVRFDFQNPEEMKSALRFREAELPFKVHNVPELLVAGEKWTDEYVAAHFDKDKRGVLKKLYAAMAGGDDVDMTQKERELAAASHVPRSKGHCQESSDSFFAFFQPLHWDVPSMGPPPTVDNDFTFARWARHARYADRVGLAPRERHYYWQAGVPREERLNPRETWTFVSRDLPSFSNPGPTFFGFNPPEQKGIQCRFGERGVTAATHYDAGRNMVAMIAGAKRYVLGPPRECSKLGIVTTKRHPTFRHSLLNFAHINLLDDEDEDAKSMPSAERAWLEVARNSDAVETVLKAGEVLYIPSHWFHYITSLQKSAQCNTRSGREREGTEHFGGFRDVAECVGEGA